MEREGTEVAYQIYYGWKRRNADDRHANSARSEKRTATKMSESIRPRSI